MNRALQGAVRCLSGPTPWYREEVWLRGLGGQPGRCPRHSRRDPRPLADGEALGHTLAQRPPGRRRRRHPGRGLPGMSAAQPVRGHLPGAPLMVPWWCARPPRPTSWCRCCTSWVTHRSAVRCWKPGRELRPLTWVTCCEADLVIAVSMHAVHFAHHFLLQTGRTWPHIDYFAVGQASADAFAEAGIQALCPGRSRSEGLLALPALQR